MQYGKQQDFLVNCEDAFGTDIFWWFLPTHPELKTNYFERVWTKKEIRKMLTNGTFEKDTDDSDPDKKLFI